MQDRSTGQRSHWAQTWRHGYDQSWYSSARKLTRAYLWTVAIVLGFFALHWLVDTLLDLFLPVLA